MSGCGNKVKYTCSESKPAECVEYEGTVNTNSSLDADSCKSVEETTQDIYNQLEDINLSELGENCLEYLPEDGRIKVKTVLLKYEEEICNLKEDIEELKNRPICNMPIGDCVNVTGLVNPCGDPITTWGELIQILINNDIP